MGINKRLIGAGATGSAGGLVPSEHFGVVLYEGDGSSSHSINGGKFGAAFYGNGSNSKITNTSLSVNTGQEFSISLWVYPQKDGSYQRILQFGNHATEFVIQKRGDDNKVRLLARISAAIQIDISSTVLNNNQWYHIVVTVDGSTAKLYVNNGTPATDVTFNIQNYSGLFIGCGEGDREFVEGKIDQVRIFNKAISAAEVTTLYNENPLVASYRFEGNANDDTRNYDGTASNVTYEYGLGFTPDFVWIKNRAAANSHNIYDTTRGATKLIESDTTDAEVTSSTGLTSFDTGGFTVSSGSGVNNSTGDYVGWCWKANGGTTSSNTDGTITSTVQANTAAGFSIVTYTGNGSTATIGHGLDSQPEMVITKSTESTSQWMIYHKDLTGNTSGDNPYNLYFLTDAELDLTAWGAYNDITSSVIPVTRQSAATAHNNNSNIDYIAYCFRSVEGFSSFGSYTGNGSTNGPIVETGFEPAFLMVKRTDSTASWIILDNKRDLTNPRDSSLKANESETEDVDNSNRATDFLSNGFQLKHSHLAMNASGGTYLYMAFAADPDTEAPTVASSFNIKTYTGDGTSNRTINGYGFNPNFLWMKPRNQSYSHNLYDTIRGDGIRLVTNTTAGNQDIQYLKFTTDGFIEDSSRNNESGVDYVVWGWKADDNEPTIFGGPAIAVYKFEDNANDVTGDYNGTATNITYSSSGKFNKSAIFDGTSRISTSLDFDTYDENWSISYWVKFTFDTNYRAILGSCDANDKNGMVSDIGTSGEIRFRLRTNTGSASALTSTGTYGDGNWHHVVCVKSSSTNYLYIDGELDSSIATTNSQSHSALNFGTFGLSSSEFYKGELDQVRIYRGVIPQEQVTELYNETVSDNDDLTLGAPPKSIVSANANAGFSIVQYEGTGANTKVPHGLGQKPDFCVIKHTNDASAWVVFSDATGTFSYSYLNLNNAFTAYPSMSYDSSVLNLNSGNDQNGAGDTHIAYFFTSIAGYSDIGSYTGNGGSNSITGLGFQPDWILIKDATSTGSWFIYDSVRTVSVGDNSGTANARPYILANANGAENGVTSYNINLDSNGFSMNTSSSELNSNGETYIYMAFKIN